MIGNIVSLLVLLLRGHIGLPLGDALFPQVIYYLNFGESFEGDVAFSAGFLLYLVC